MTFAKRAKYVDSPFALQQFYDLSDALCINGFLMVIRPNRFCSARSSMSSCCDRAFVSCEVACATK